MAQRARGVRAYASLKMMTMTPNRYTNFTKASTDKSQTRQGFRFNKLISLAEAQLAAACVAPPSGRVQCEYMHQSRPGASFQRTPAWLEISGASRFGA